MSAAQTPPSDIRSLRTLLIREHAQLDALFDRLLAAVDADANAAARLWSEFDTQLRAHLELEEQYILPAFGRSHPSDAATIQLEHSQIRAALIELGIGVDLHLSRADMVARFIELLRRHAAREEASMYRWSEEDFPQSARSTVLERLLGRLKLMPESQAHVST